MSKLNNNESIINIKDVWLSYDKINYVLQGITLSVKNSTNYTIVGHSGSGKSTLLKLINGVLTPSSGYIDVIGKIPNINNNEFKHIIKKIGYIPQSLGLIKNISILDNVLIGALPRINKFKSFLKIFPTAEITNAENALKMVGLDDKIEQKTYTLSGGEKRRVAIARALVQKPIILLADEIVSELDHVTAKEIMELILDAQHKMNLTAIMVHHNIKLALEYADVVSVLKKGRKILEIGVDGNTITKFNMDKNENTET